MYQRANSSLRDCPNDSSSSENDSDGDAEPSSKLLIDLKKMPEGQYEYYTEMSSIMNQLLLY